MDDDNLVVGPFNKDTRPAFASLLVDTEREIALLQQVAIQARTSINRCSPISSLPPEALLEIFMLCCQPNYNAIGGVDSQGICPLRLSAVCRAWRDLAWTTSCLWSVIILMKRNFCHHASHLEEILASWIERAGNHSLSIRYEAKSNRLLHLLAQKKSKWMNVSITILASEYLHGVIEDHEYFPLLQHLSICVLASSSGPSFLRDSLHGLEDLDIFNTTSLPKITHLHVPKYIQRFNSNSMWSQLRTFSVSTIGAEGLCKILDLARSLEVFNTDSLEPHSGYQPLTVIHSNLRHLILKEVYSTVLNDLLSKPYISTPNLEDLTIEMNYGSPDSASLSNFMTSFHQLQRFSVKYYDSKDPNQTFNWLLNIPSLTKLDVETSASEIINFASALGRPASTGTEPEYFPLLIDLTITLRHLLKGNLMMKDIVEMLAYRSSGVSPSILRLKTALLSMAYVPFTKENFETVQATSLGDLVLTMVDPKGLSQSWYILFFSLIYSIQEPTSGKMEIGDCKNLLMIF